MLQGIQTTAGLLQRPVAPSRAGYFGGRHSQGTHDLADRSRTSTPKPTPAGQGAQSQRSDSPTSRRGARLLHRATVAQGANRRKMLDFSGDRICFVVEKISADERKPIPYAIKTKDCIRYKRPPGGTPAGAEYKIGDWFRSHASAPQFKKLKKECSRYHKLFLNDHLDQMRHHLNTHLFE